MVANLGRPLTGEWWRSVMVRRTTGQCSQVSTAPEERWMRRTDFGVCT